MTLATGADHLDGVTAATALGRLLVGTGLAWGAKAVVIGPACQDPLPSALSAIGRGSGVLIEPVAACGVEGLREIARAAARAGVTAVPAFRRRLEPELAWARSSISAGAIGLPWGVHAESLSSAASDPLTEALDLLDAVAFASGLRPVEVVRLDRSSRRGPEAGVPVVLSVGFDHGGVGQVIARCSTSPEPPGTEVATFRVTGSHGTIQGDLDGPALDRRPDRPDADRQAPARVDASGTQRLLDTFTAAAGGGPVDALVSLERAADLLDVVSMTSRSRRRDPPCAS